MQDTAPQKDAIRSASYWDELQNRNGVAYLPNTDDAFNGFAKQTYKNRQIKILGLFKNGFLVRLSEWEENGTPVYKVGFMENQAEFHELSDIRQHFDKDISRQKGRTIFNGTNTFYYENGQKRSHAEYKDGWAHGVITQWYINGKQKLEATFVEGYKNGPFTEWYENGQNRRIGNSKNKKYYGLFTEWYKDGTKKEESKWEDGKLISAKLWGPNGELCPETNIKNGHGVFLENTEDGFKIRISYQNGEKNGLTTVWYNGKKHSEANYSNGQKNGLSGSWYEGGQKKSKGNFTNGEKEGLWTTWFRNGLKETEGRFVNGKKEGLWTTWLQQGKKGFRLSFVNDREAGEIDWFNPEEQKIASATSFAFVTNGKYPFWDLCVAGVKIAEKELGLTCEILMPDSEIVDQKRIIESLVAKEIDGIAVSPIDPQKQTPVLNEVAASTILITHDADAPLSDRKVFIGANNYKSGRALGELVQKALPNGGKIMIFSGKLNHTNARQRRKGVIDGIFDITSPSDISTPSFLHEVRQVLNDHKSTIRSADGLQYTRPIHDQNLSQTVGVYSDQNIAYIGLLKNSKAHGDWITFFADGKIRYKGGKKDGLNHGSFTTWYPEGQIRVKGSYAEGKKHGISTHWFPNGQKMKIQKHHHGRAVGRWQTYEEDGKLEKVIDFANIKPVQPKMSKELLSAVKNWESIPQSVFPLRSVKIKTPVESIFRQSNGTIVARSTLRAGAEVVAIGVLGQQLMVKPTVESKMTGSLFIDQTDFKQGVAYLFEMRKIQRSEYRNKKLSFFNWVPHESSLFEDLPLPSDFGHGKFCICLDCRQKRQPTFDKIEDPYDLSGLMISDSKYTILGTMTDNYRKQSTYDNAINAIKKHKDIDCMVGLFAYNSPACIEALNDAGKLGIIKVCGFDEEDSMLQAISDGHAYGTISQEPWQYGYLSIKVLHEIHKGKTLSSQYVEVPTVQITKDNLDAFWKKKKEMAKLGKSLH